MKLVKYITFIFILMALLLTEGNVYSKSKSLIKWHDYSVGVNLAKKYKKQILVDFYADWCTWCRVMDQEIFSDPQIASQINKNFVCIKVKTDSDTQKIRIKGKVLNTREFAASVGVKGLPAVLFLNAKQEALLLVPGYVKKDLFSPILKYINNKCYRNNVTVNDYISGNMSCAGGKKG